MSYIVIDMASGAMDGIYAEKEAADKMLEHFDKHHPNRKWAVVKIVNKKGPVGIPDHLWHINLLGYGKNVAW